MQSNDAMQQELIATFKLELDEQTQLIVELLLALEKNQLSVEEKQQAIQKLFRAAHTIKGAARSVSYNEISEIAHNIESLFNKIQKKEETLTAKMISECLASVDQMRSIINPKIHSDSTTGSDSIRVEVDVLDKINSLMEDFILNQISLNEYNNKVHKIETMQIKLAKIWDRFNRYVYDELGESISDDIHRLNLEAKEVLNEQLFQLTDYKKNIHYKTNDLSMLTHLLQDEFNKLRLVPASTMFSIMPRLVRDLSLELNKKINFELVGGDVKMDKIILEHIKDPIIHLLRNAIDHGIEPVDVRRAKGKPDSGKIKINIIDDGNRIKIEVSDDGAGIDLAKIKQLAIEKNLYEQKVLQNLNQQEILNIIFLPGFSTKSTVSQVSGRGIGLDVVLSNIEIIKGKVDITTEVNKGTTFTLSLPLTLSSERGLFIKANGNIYAIPSTSIERIYVTLPQNINPVAGGHVVVIDNQPISVYLLSSLIGGDIDYFSNDKQVVMVILKKANQRIALLVDEVVNEREMIVKPLQPPLSTLSTVAGGTISEEGDVIYVFNPMDLIDRALNNDQSKQITFVHEEKPIPQAPHILVVDDSITTRTLERNILESQNYLVSIAVNGKDAWDLLQKINFSLIITDINMPVMDGFELTEKIKQSPAFKDLPVVIVTSLESEDEKRKGLEVGANAYIIKSEFESGALLEIVSQLVK